MEQLEISNKSEEVKEKKSSTNKCSCDKRLKFVEEEIERINAQVSILKKAIKGK